MRCDEFNDELDALIDRGVDWETDVALRGHLTQCESCRELSAAYRALLLGARGLMRPQPSAPLAEQIVQAWQPAGEVHSGVPATESWSTVQPDQGLPPGRRGARIQVPRRNQMYGSWAAALALAASLLVVTLVWRSVPTTESGQPADHLANQPPAPSAELVDKPTAAAPVAQTGQQRPLRHLAREASQKYRSLAVATRAGVFDALLIVPGVQPAADAAANRPSATAPPATVTSAAPATSTPAWIEQMTAGFSTMTGTAAGTLDVLWQAIPTAEEDHRS